MTADNTTTPAAKDKPSLRRTRLLDSYPDIFRPDHPVKPSGPGLREVKLRFVIPTQTEDGTDSETAQVNDLRARLKAVGYLDQVQRTQEAYQFTVSFKFKGVFTSDHMLLNHLFARLDHIIAPSKLLHDGFCDKRPTWVACKGDDDYEIQEGTFGLSATAAESWEAVITENADAAPAPVRGRLTK